MIEPLIVLGRGSLVGASHPLDELIGILARNWRSAHIIGKAGYGKSSLIRSIVVQAISEGISCSVLDPAGDLYDDILAELIQRQYFELNPNAFSKTVFLNVAKALACGFAFPYDVLATRHDAYITADLIVEALRRAFPAMGSGTATNIELLVSMGSFVLASNQKPLFPYLYYLLVNTPFRREMLKGITDTLVLDFFEEFTGEQGGRLTIRTDTSLKKFFQLLFQPVMRYTLGQKKNILNFRQEILDHNRSVFINLSSLPPGSMRFLGCLYTVFAEIDAKSRADISPDKRSIHLLILDEFQNFTAQSGDALRDILEQCRKYNVFLVLAHQNWEQVRRDLKGALNQCGLAVMFHLEREDAEISTPSFNFPYDPYKIKPQPAHLLQLGHSTSSYSTYSRAEQRDMDIESVINLDVQEAYMRLPNNNLYRVMTPTTTKPKINKKELDRIEAEFYKQYFRPISEIEKDISETMQEFHAKKSSDTIGDDKRNSDDIFGDNEEGRDYDLFWK